jgi:hypothetical protein
VHTLEYLLANSRLPGPRGNLELLYDFSRNCGIELVEQCLGRIRPDTANSPEEFLGMCGVLGYAAVSRADVEKSLAFIKQYASHGSWRIREAVAMAIQELSEGRLGLVLPKLGAYIAGNCYERRAVVAGLCEPKLLGDRGLDREILRVMREITDTLGHDDRLGDPEESLRKALGYGWSVIIAASPEDGRRAFEELFDLPGRHVRWIMKENLGKNRLLKMDREWVAACRERIG